jgi:hypothetical protein
MKTASFITCVGITVSIALLTGGIRPAFATPTSLQFFSDVQTYVVSGTQKSTMYPTAEGDTNFQGKGAMMISANVADSVANPPYSARTMDALFSFNTGTNQTGNAGTYLPATSSSPTGVDITSAFNTQYGAGNWHITSISVALASNYTEQGIQPNNDDFNLVASGLFSLEVLGSNPNLTTVTYNTLTNNILPATSATSVGTFQWNAIGPPWISGSPNNTNNTSSEPQTTYNLTLNNSLISAVMSGEFTLFGVAADNQVGYLFNTSNRLAPELTITADVGPPPAVVPAMSPAVACLCGAVLAGMIFFRSRMKA